MANLYSVPLKNSIQHTLAATLTISETGTITLDSAVDLELQATASMKGILVIDRVDVNGVATPLKTEYIAYTGVSGSTVTGLTRGLAGTSAQGHSIGSIVEFVPDVTWAQAINDVFTTQHNADGTHKVLSGLSLASSSIINSSITNSTLDNSTFKSVFSGATQGDLITFNNNNFQRLQAGETNQILSLNSTASGLVPTYIYNTQFYKTRLNSTSVGTTLTGINNSVISLSVPYNANAELVAYIDNSINNANNAWTYQFARASTLIEQNYPQRPEVGSGQNTIAIGALISLASGSYSFSIQALTDGNTLTVYNGYFWIKVYPKF